MIILKALYFILPAYLANMAPVLVKKIDFLDYPIDFNLHWRGRPILGKNKTWRGLVFGVFAAIAVVYLQAIIFPFFDWTIEISYIKYYQINVLTYGFLFGFGAIFGDALKSFFKRRLNKAPGARWFPFDQIDFIVGALIFISFVEKAPWSYIVILLLVTPVLHIITNHIGYYLKLQKNKW